MEKNIWQDLFDLLKKILEKLSIAFVIVCVHRAGACCVISIFPRKNKHPTKSLDNVACFL